VSPAPDDGVAVVVCTRSPARFELLVGAVQSIHAQTSPAHEVVVVVDHNPALLARVSQLPGVSVVANRGRQGLSDSRNTGIAETTSALIAFLDDDAVADRDWLCHLAKAFEDPRTVAAGGEVLAQWEAKRPGWFPAEFDWVFGCSYRGLPRQRATIRNPIGANMAIRRAPVVALQGFRGDLGRAGTAPWGCEETELCVRLRAAHPDAQVVYEPLARVWHHVPVERMRWSYFWRRCWAEGRSKGRIARSISAPGWMSPERAHAARTLPLAVTDALRECCSSRSAVPLRRGGAVVAGLAVTTAGYVSERSRLRGSEGTPGHSGFDPRLAPLVAATSLADATTDDAHSVGHGPAAELTVVIPTRDRPTQLARCLESVSASGNTSVEVIVVHSGARVVLGDLRSVTDVAGGCRIRHIAEPRPGTSRARNRGLAEATGRLVAFIDDDVTVTPQWSRTIIGAFRDESELTCVTGCVRPADLTTAAQRWAARVGGYEYPRARARFDLQHHRVEHPVYPFLPGQMGSGANMAFDAARLRALGGFDEALGPGTFAGGAEELDCFLRVLFAGGRILHEPGAVVHHFAPTSNADARRRAYRNGVGLTAVATKWLLVRSTRRAALRLAVPGFARLVELLRRTVPEAPLGTRLLALVGAVVGPVQYVRGRRASEERGITPPVADRCRPL